LKKREPILFNRLIGLPTRKRKAKEAGHTNLQNRFQ